ncbi:MAG: SCO family protein [Bdellovibrionaceae bacterium]|nr:SCO family protein [Pseudobdellovibrionaceae bacterium]
MKSILLSMLFLFSSITFISDSCLLFSNSIFAKVSLSSGSPANRSLFLFANRAYANVSLFELSTVWKNQNNEDVVLSDLKGSPTLITMMYTSCVHTCPMIVSKLEEINKQLKKAKLPPVKVVMASFDEKADTPEALKAYMKKRKLSEKDWTLLSPSSTSTARELSVLLGISFKKLDDKDFSHSNIITLLDKDGVAIAKIESLAADTKVFVEALKKQIQPKKKK